MRSLETVFWSSASVELPSARAWTASALAHAAVILLLLTIRPAERFPAPSAAVRLTTLGFQTPARLAPRPRPLRTPLRRTVRIFHLPDRPPRTLRPPVVVVPEPPSIRLADIALPAPAPRLELPPQPLKLDNFTQARAPEPSPSPRPAISAGAFGDASVVSAPPVSQRLTHSAGILTAAEILSKPRPAYTDEARRLQIEGEVLLEIEFAAAGEVRVLRVIRGLGHGLDETAVTAAREIRFRPARRDGAAVGSTAVVHITFQLAY